MAIKELPVFPQTTYSESQGLVGVRQWQLDHGDNIEKFCDFICKSHWPSYPDAIPVQVQSGAYNNDTVIKCAGACTKETMGPLPQLGAYKVVAHYAMHRMSNKWPAKIPKPWHPNGTTLSLKIRAAGQILMVTPAGIHVSPSELDDSQGCSEQSNLSQNPTNTDPSMPFCCMTVPVTEYHISCDRMTIQQVNTALHKHDWDDLQGHVNKEDTPVSATKNFLGAPEGTALFDGYEIDESWACDVRQPQRYRMTFCIKQRVITSAGGIPAMDLSGKHPVGWNHDYVAFTDEKSGYGWKYIQLRKTGTDGQAKCEPRYPATDFHSVFGESGDQQLGKCSDGTDGTITDSDLCGKFDVCAADGEAAMAVDNIRGSVSVSSGWRGSSEAQQ